MPIVTNQNELKSALASATGGETIVLKDGTYGAITVSKDYASTVTIQADNALKAAIKSLTVSGASNVRFESIAFDSQKNGGNGSKVVSIQDKSRDIAIVDSEVTGKQDNVYEGHNGIQIKKSSNITLHNNDVHDVFNGIVVFGGSGIRVTDNIVDHVGNDVMKFGSISNSVISGNASFGHVYPLKGAHDDFIQFQGASHDVLITGNLYLAKNSPSIQGIFLNNASYNDITISENVIYTGMSRGISVSKGSGIVVDHNTLLNVPGEVHKGTGIYVPGGSRVTDNIITSYEGGTFGSNIKLQNIDRGDAYYVDNYYVNGSEGRGVTVADLKPVKGSAAETKGAADTIAAFLNGGPSSGGGSAPSSGPEPEPAPTEPEPEPTQPAPEPAPAPTSGDFTITLVDAGSDTLVEELSDGESATVPTPAGRRTIDVDFSGNPGSIFMDLERGNGAAVTTKLENIGPYSLTGDSSGDYNLPDFDFRDGAYSLTVTAYGGANRSGAVLGTETVDFTLEEEGSTSAPASAPAPEQGSAGVPSGALFAMAGDTTFKGRKSDIVTVSHAPKFEVAEGSIGFRFQADDVSGRKGLVSKDAHGYDGGGHHFSTYLRGDSLEMRFQDANSNVTLKTDVRASTSYDVLATFDADEIRFYLDDTLVGRRDFTMDWTENGQVMQVGGLGWASDDGGAKAGSPFDGVMSDVFILDQALTPAEVDALL